MKRKLFAGIIMMLCLSLMLGSIVSFAESSEETYGLTINIKFVGNLIFSKYNVRLKLDGKQITIMEHGKDYAGIQNVTAGNHVITFYKEDNDKVSGRADVYVEGVTSFSCTIYVFSDEIQAKDIKITSIPSGQKSTRGKALDTTYFGRYEQDKKTENGSEPIEWYVAEKNDGKTLLISTKTLDNQQFNTSSTQTTWENSSIRRWLNSTFLSTAFTEDERNAIVETSLENMQADTKGEWSKKEAENTSDKIFLLSYSEYLKYLQLDEEKDSPATTYANSRGSNWNIWLRTPGKNSKEMQYFSGSSYDSDPVTNSNAIRPALWIDDQADKSLFSYEKYNEAKTLKQAGKYAEAAEIFDSLKGYSGSAAQAKECKYQHALQLHQKGENTAAIEILDRMRDYKDSVDVILDCRYAIACEYKNNGEYETALKAFTEVGQYKQTMEYIRECYEKLHIQYSWLTKNTGSVVNAGTKEGYVNRDGIATNDPHFGWSLGRFMMSGYTELKEEGSRPVFLKTPGDSVTLWFDLSQDINKLNGNDGLRINRDTDGADQDFQYPKSDFGRGMLLVRHIDFRNSDSEVQAYKDYLAAKDGTGANTSVQLNEEGIYEVALDYEVEKKGIISGYTNYRIFTTFEVRNGSGMFFMFDVSTGNELQDYSRTADGFRIDLANSHSLSISYTRYAMNQEETGLDVRKTGPATDGDTFEKVGYYVITVTNKETNEQLTKHIFVGRAADLEEYQEVDDSLSKFSK